MENDIIVMPDIHGRTFWKRAVEMYPGADTIFLGDYLDPYPFEGRRLSDVVSNFHEILDYAAAHKNVTLLLGNHDIAYWLPCNWSRKITDMELEIFLDFRNNIDLFHLFAEREVDGKRWLFSHAPLFEEWLDFTELTRHIPTLDAYFHKALAEYNRYDLTEENLQEMSKHYNAIYGDLGRVSMFRGGDWDCGSPIWADVREVEHGCTLYRDADYHVFGHTQLRSPLITDRYACLDARQAFKISPKGKITPIP